MADAKEPEKDLAKLEKEQELEDAAFLENLEKDSKEFNKVCDALATRRSTTDTVAG